MKKSSLVERYSRQMLIPQIGINNQLVLSESKVLIIGVGGIGSTVALYLAGAGVGQVDVLDFDQVEASNLHRQIIHDETTIGISKVTSATTRIHSLNSHINCHGIEAKITSSNIVQYIELYDVIVDATDNYESRYIINDACVLLHKPLVSGSAVGLDGQITIFYPPHGPCYRCLYPSMKSTGGTRSCADSGVLGPIPGMIGCLQAIETIKLLTQLNYYRNLESNIATTKDGFNSLNHNSPKDNESSKPVHTSGNTVLPFETLINKQIFYNGLSGDMYTFDLGGPDPQCILCGQQEFRTIHTMEDSSNNVEEMTEKLQCASTVSLNTLSSILSTQNTMTIQIFWKQLCKLYMMTSNNNDGDNDDSDSIKLSSNTLGHSKEDISQVLHTCKSDAIITMDLVNGHIHSFHTHIPEKEGILNTPDLKVSQYTTQSNSANIKRISIVLDVRSQLQYDMISLAHYQHVNISNHSSALVTVDDTISYMMNTLFSKKHLHLLHIPCARLLSMNVYEILSSIIQPVIDGDVLSLTRMYSISNSTKNHEAVSMTSDPTTTTTTTTTTESSTSLATTSIIPTTNTTTTSITGHEPVVYEDIYIDVYVLCRRGIDSIRATHHILHSLQSQMTQVISPSQTTVTTSTTSMSMNMNMSMLAMETNKTSNIIGKKLDDSLQYTSLIGGDDDDQQIPLISERISYKRIHIQVMNVEGGLTAWKQQIDVTFPFY